MVQTKTALVLSFLVISMIPVALMSAVSFISLLKLQQNISNMYNGAVVIVTSLSGGHRELLEMRLDVGRYITAGHNDLQKRAELLTSIRQDENAFLKTLIMYKEIDDFPLQVDILERRGMGNLTSYEKSLLSQVDGDWLDYQRERNKVLALADEGKEQEAILYSNTVAADEFEKLAGSYNQIVGLNNDLARIMYEESQSVVAQATVYASISAVSSAVFAVAAALVISRRLAPSVDEIQRAAKKKIEAFIAEGRMIQQQQQQQSDSTTAIAAAAAVTPPPSPPQHREDVHPAAAAADLAAAATAAMAGSYIPKLAEKGPLILVHSSGYEGARKKEAGGGGTGRSAEKRSTAELLLDYYLFSPYSISSSPSSQQPEQQQPASAKKPNLVLITKRSSNLYPLGRSAGAAMYILSSSSQEPVSTSADGLLILSITQTSLILEAVKRTLGENPQSVIILDNITEMIHKLGFDRVFSLVQSMSDAASLYPSSRIIILINEHAHPPSEVEAIATICNVFVR